MHAVTQTQVFGYIEKLGLRTNGRSKASLMKTLIELLFSGLDRWGEWPISFDPNAYALG